MGTINEIQAGRYNDLLHKLLSMKEGAPAPTLSPEIVPILVLENDRPEWHFPGGSVLASAFTTVAATPAQFQGIYFVNPLASGVIAVLTRVRIPQSSGATLNVGIIAASAAPAVSQAGFIRDARFGAVSTAVGLSSNVNAAALAAPQDRIFASGSNQVDMDNFGYILPAGFALAFVATAQNTGFTLAFNWYQRAVEPSEMR